MLLTRETDRLEPAAVVASRDSAWRRRTPPTRQQIVSALLGMITVLLLFEVFLRHWAFHFPQSSAAPIAADSGDQPVETVHYFREGIATSHFTRSHARLTGNPTIAGAPWIVILGDSFVEGIQVEDRDTMGSQLEQLARGHNEPLNVRQYGWSGDAPAHYALLAPEVKRKWHPKMVVAVTNVDDYSALALDTPFAVLHIHDGEGTAISKPVAAEGLRKSVWPLIKQSALGEYCAIRFKLDILPTFYSSASPQKQKPATPDEQMGISLRLMKNAYGSSLFVVYTAEPGLSGRADPDETLLRECEVQGVRCVLARTAWLNDLRSGIIPSGYSNSAPGSGHYNRVGYGLIAQLIWDEIQRRTSQGSW